MFFFWQSNAGEQVRLHRRRMASLRVTLKKEAPTKKMRKNETEQQRLDAKHEIAEEATSSRIRIAWKWDLE